MLNRFLPDQFVIILLATIAVAILLPATGNALTAVSALSNTAIFALFFFHGLRLSHSSVIDGLTQWRLQLAVLMFGFVAMPIAGFALATSLPALLPPELWMGILFLCALPSTVQSAIAYSSIANGNVAASLIAAALSNLLGVVLTPLLVALLFSMSGTNIGPTAVIKIAVLLLLPFIVGQSAQKWLSPWAERRKAWIGRMDKFTIIAAVYAAFSAATADNIWARVSTGQLATVTVVVMLLLGFALSACWTIGGLRGWPMADRITMLFSGSQKTLATGAPMARILFPGAEAGLIIIPLMIYHQMQLIVSALIAARLNRAT